MTHDEMIEVIRAHRDGKAIQYRLKYLGDTDSGDGKSIQYRRKYLDDTDSGAWVNVVSPLVWAFGNTDYRVKSEPREFRLCPERDNKQIDVCTACRNSPCTDSILVREVIE